MKRGRGQPTKRTPAIEELVLELLALGRSRGHTERLVGVSRGSLRHWENADSSFSSRIAQAIAEGEHRRLRILEAAAGSVEEPKDPKVLQWLLARQFPKKYGERNRVDAHVKIDVERLSDRELDERIARLERAETLAPSRARTTSKRAATDE